MSPPLFFSKENGSVTSSLRDAFLLLPDGQYRCTIEKVKKIRSPEQNRLYWSILQIIDTYSHQGTDELHALFKKEFLKSTYVKSKLDGRKKRKLQPSTTKLTTEEFIDYNRKVMEFGRAFFQIEWSKHNL